jgi:hypothetical protein
MSGAGLGGWPIYISDTWHVECREPGCDDGEFGHPGRRSTVREFLRAVQEHAEREHGMRLNNDPGLS